MPNPHFRVNHISRGAGQNAVASAAYRAAETLYEYRSPLDAAAYQAGETLTDEKRGEVYSFVRKEGVIAKEIYAPGDAPEWARDREKLWNAVERAEDKSTRRSSARLAVDFVGSLPRELSHDEHRTIVARFVQDQFTRKGLVADVSFHSVKARDGKQNPHVHMMVTTREIGADGFGDKARWMDKKETLQRWRGSWEHHTNRLLEAAGRDERLSLQTLAAQGIDREPTKPLGYEASALEKKGIATRRGDENRRIVADNALRDEARKRAEAEESGGGGRTPLWSDFSSRLSAGTDAARDAVHRFRAKDAEKEGDTMSDRGRGGAPASAPSSGTTAGTGQTADAGRGGDMAARLGESARAAAVEAARGLIDAGIQDRGNVSQAQSVAPNATPRQEQSNTTERYQGRTLDGNDSPRQGPGTPPAGVSRSGSATGTGQGADAPAPRLDAAASQLSESTRGGDMAARLGEGARSEAKAAANTILQQNDATMQQGARDAGPKQSAQQQQGAAVGQDSAKDFYDKHGGKAAEADKNLDQQKQQTREHER